MTKKIHHIASIINPAAGADQPILLQMSKATAKYKVMNEIYVTQSLAETRKFTRKAIQSNVDAILVYGGDGTIVDVANELLGSKIPLIIIPGGTANVIAKELGIPMDTEEAFKILKRKPKATHVNVAKMGKQHMMLRVEVGILASMVKKTKKESKESLGVLAYPLTAMKEAANAKSAQYTISVDGKKEKIEGVGLMIANIGNVGLPDVSINSKVKCDDNLLDLFVLQSSDITSLVSLGTSVLMGGKKPVALKHWQGKNIKVSISPEQPIICDDKPIKATRLSLSLLAEQITILT